MLIVLNIVILLFLLGAAAVWSTYGFFSALLNLLIVIASGLLALALWEPLSYWLLGRMPFYAHGVGLLAPFALLLIVFRGVFDKLCRMNVQVPRLVDQVGGGVLGLFSGVLAMGMVLNAANFMPLARSAFGWEPYTISQNGEMTDNEGGRLWSFARVHEWSASFYTTLADGAMRPISGPTISQARPNLAMRAVMTRLAPDENQVRTAHPDNVKVTGLYSVPATEQALRALVDRAAIMPFLSPGYTLPEDVEHGPNGTGIISAVFKEYRARHDNPGESGIPSEMINIEAMQAAVRKLDLPMGDLTQPEGFERLVQRVAKRVGDDLVEQMKPVLNENARLLFVDTRWNAKPAGAYNADGKLRLAMTQVGLQPAGDDGLKDLIRPIGFSVEYSQNSNARTFTELVSTQRFSAYSPFNEFSLGLAFVMPNNQQARRLFVRELRFDLTDLPAPEGEDGRESTNLGEAAFVMGLPLVTDEQEEEADEGSSAVTEGGVEIAGTGALAEVSEDLPMTFTNTAAGLEVNEDDDPWTLISGDKDGLPRGRGGRKSSVREIYVDDTERLVRIKLDNEKAGSLLGKAVQAAEALGALYVRDEGGNTHPAIGYAHLRANQQLDLDINKTAADRIMIAKDLPTIRDDETLMVYFRVPVNTKVTAFMLGSDIQKFAEPLEVTAKRR